LKLEILWAYNCTRIAHHAGVGWPHRRPPFPTARPRRDEGTSSS